MAYLSSIHFCKGKFMLYGFGSSCNSIHIQPTHIVHFAAQSHVQTSFSDALQYTQDNIVGTHTLLEATAVSMVEYSEIHSCILRMRSNGESMLDMGEKHKTEHSILCPTNPYAATKAGAELIAQSYNHSFNMPIVITRGNNVYGSKSIS